MRRNYTSMHVRMHTHTQRVSLSGRCLLGLKWLKGKGWETAGRLFSVCHGSANATGQRHGGDSKSARGKKRERFLMQGKRRGGGSQIKGGEGWGMLCTVGHPPPDLCVGASLSCSQLPASVRGGHGCLALLCCSVPGASAQRYLRALEYLSAVCCVQLMLVMPCRRAEGSST